MPGGNGTGPSGMGPMTGRGMGYCAGNSAPGTVTPAFGRGMGLGFRGGRGGGWAGPYRGYPYDPRPYPPAFGAAPGPEQETGDLQQQVQDLEQTLEQIKKRLSELEG